MSKNINNPKNDPLWKEAVASAKLSDNHTWQAIGAYAEAKDEIARLTAENERLRKIGFKMREMIGDHAWTLAWDAECKFSPYAAKEGRDAK